ncbi:hypothetical protein [Methylobacterium nodulans]|uniref:Uncharacterized protein n=1 Tax=Methylobacterium nodulans (strain LMG 21967 / CNCM I-2342 / ORS 2060) TaxID=460265 RepID=B8IRS2_METNO|nr:hypothetical protein [Methylobacterium nodulans]ACL60622.1 hypothetical protein Mnod_5793 [Methylobacterium nodulans ORS 2060]
MSSHCLLNWSVAIHRIAKDRRPVSAADRAEARTAASLARIQAMRDGHLARGTYRGSAA